MLRLIPLRRLDALMTLRSTMNRYPVSTCSHRRLFSDSPAAATIAAAAQNQHRWVMLNHYGIRTNESCVADSKTVAEAHTSTGRLLRVSLRCAAPPASSKLCYDFPQEQEVGNDNVYLNVADIHGDLFLLDMRRGRRTSAPVDHFVYSPACDARLPSLSQLPVRDFLTKAEDALFVPYMHMVQPPRIDNTGLLRRGENGVLVVQAHMWFDRNVPRDQRQLMAELCVFRPGMRQWELMQPVPIHLDQGVKGDELILNLRSPKDVVSISDRYLCWVHYRSGFVLCDMADERSPKARYVPFPDELTCFDYRGNDYDDSDCDDVDNDDDHSVSDGDSDDDEHLYRRFMGAVGDRDVRLVSIDSHRGSGCTINTWTMKLGADEPLVWVKDGEMDSEELWELSQGYEGLPRLGRLSLLYCTRVRLDLDNPDVVVLFVFNASLDEKVWMIQLNMKTRTLLSAVKLFTTIPGECCSIYRRYNFSTNQESTR